MRINCMRRLRKPYGDTVSLLHDITSSILLWQHFKVQFIVPWEWSVDKWSRETQKPAFGLLWLRLYQYLMMNFITKLLSPNLNNIHDRHKWQPVTIWGENIWPLSQYSVIAYNIHVHYSNPWHSSYGVGLPAHAISSLLNPSTTLSL